MHSHCVVMSRLGQIGDFMPLIFRDVVDFTLLTCRIRVLATDRIDIVLRFEVKFAVQVNELMTASGMVHRCSNLDLILVFIDNEALFAEDATDLIFFLLTSDKEDLILSLH